MKHIFFFITIFLVFAHAQTKNPIVSPTFDTLIKSIIGEDEYIFDDKNIKIQVPNFADNPVQVPIFVDAKRVENAKRMVIFADLNPISTVLDMEVGNLLPVFSTNIKVAQETPLRALVLDDKNIWHVGSANINSNGGGCDISSQASSNNEFAKLLGKTKGQLFFKNDLTRIKASVFHPMETGLIFGNEEFYIHTIKISNENKAFATVKITSGISENPRLIFETKKDIKTLNMQFLDNDGNTFKLDIK